MTILEVVEARLGPEPEGHEWDCPFCKAAKSLTVRPDRGVFLCLVCGHNGSAAQFVAMFERVSLTQAMEKLGEIPTVPAVLQRDTFSEPAPQKAPPRRFPGTYETKTS